MERLNRLLKHELFQDCMKRIGQAEQDRIYCRHDRKHSLDVARIAYILNMEEQMGFDKEFIYAMALLHDLGRSEEYEQGRSHHEAGAELAAQILPECGFTPEETKRICTAIAAHKNAGDEGADSCVRLLYRADKLSRDCYDCLATETCYWKEECRNYQVLY